MAYKRKFNFDWRWRVLNSCKTQNVNFIINFGTSPNAHTPHHATPRRFLFRFCYKYSTTSCKVMRKFSFVSTVNSFYFAVQRSCLCVRRLYSGGKNLSLTIEIILIFSKIKAKTDGTSNNKITFILYISIYFTGARKRRTWRGATNVYFHTPSIYMCICVFKLIFIIANGYKSI